MEKMWIEVILGKKKMIKKYSSMMEIKLREMVVNKIR